MPDEQPSIKIKLLGKFKPGLDGHGWFDRFPGSSEKNTTFGNCTFTFDRHERDYNWLVVWDDLPSVSGERHTLWEEKLACPRDNTMLVTTEPSTIKVYGSRFLSQFGHVLTTQEPWAAGNHPGLIQEQTSYVWFYANGHPRGRYDAIRDHVPLEKTGLISTVCSTKKQRSTLHKKRFEFIQSLRPEIPQMEVYGRGIRFVENKADALDPYKYHIAIENFYGPHHWTEKLSDPFLGACMPIYYGCPNAENYFPPESFIRIDIDNLELSAEAIKRAIKDRIYEKNIKSILESRRRILQEYAPIVNICRLVNLLNKPDAIPPDKNDTIMSRHFIRKKNLFNALSYLTEKSVVSLKHRLETSRAK